MLNVAGAVGRGAHRLLTLVLTLGVAVVIVAAALAWRLSQGPVEVDWLARRIEAAASVPNEPTRLTIGKAAVQWGGFAAGPEQGLQLQLRDVHLNDLAGNPIATVAMFDLSVSMARLLLGQVAPRAIAATGLNLRLMRDAAGGVTLDLGGLGVTHDATPDNGGDNHDATGPTASEALAELARPLRQPGVRAVRPDLQHIEELQSVHIADSTLQLHDSRLAPAVQLDIAALDLRRLPGGGVRGTADATLALAAARATVALQANLAPEGGTEVQLTLAPINAASVQAAAPALATDDTLDAAVQGAATLRLDPKLHPTRATLQLGAGAGHLRLAGAAIGFDSLALDAAATWDRPAWTRPQHLDLRRSRAVLRAPGGRPSTLTVGAQLDIAPTRLAGSIDATLDRLAFADIGALWPERLGGHIRPWLVPNVTAGIARDGAIKLGFEAAGDLSEPVVKSVDGSLKGEDVTVWWVRPVPPVQGAQALLTITDPQTLDIAISTARQGTMALKDGLIRITGLQDKDQYMALGASVQAGVPELIALLRNPRLQLLDRKPIPMRNPAGSATGHLGVNMMLKDKIEFSDIHLQTSTHLTGLRLGGIVAGRDLDHGDIQLDVTSETLKATGTAGLSGLPSDITVDMDFRGGPANQTTQRAQASTRATGAQLAAAGLDPAGLMPSGAGQFTAKYTERRDGSADVQVHADLNDAGLAVVGWRKPPGQPAEASATLLIRGDHLAGIEHLHAQGSGMALEARVEMVGNRPLNLVLDQIVLGPTQAHGQIRFPATPNEPIRASLTGPVLDLSTQFGHKPDAPSPAKPDAHGTPWVADIRFDRVLLAGERGLGGVVAHAEDDGTRFTVANVTTSGPEHIEIELKPQGTGRHLLVHAADGGALLRAADLLDTVQGGRLVVDATYDDTRPGAPLSGTADLTGFSVRNAPALGKLLQAVTIYGMVDALRGPGLSFSKLLLPFRWDGTVLETTDAQAFSASLGLTARGQIDTERKTIALQGTVVPAYMFNSLLGRIPLIGRLFSAERGGGLLALDYTIKGPLADPAVHVNPLSALTPGFLRGLFHILD